MHRNIHTGPVLLLLHMYIASLIGIRIFRGLWSPLVRADLRNSMVQLVEVATEVFGNIVHDFVQRITDPLCISLSEERFAISNAAYAEGAPARPPKFVSPFALPIRGDPLRSGRAQSSCGREMSGGLVGLARFCEQLTALEMRHTIAGVWPPIRPSSILTSPLQHPFHYSRADLVSRLFARMGMGSYRIGDLFKRSLFLISLTWAPLALLAIVDNIHWIQSPGQNFFLDFTGYGQFILF